MNSKELEVVEETIREVFTNSRSVSFKTKSTLENLIKKISTTLRNVEIENENKDEDIETFKVGRIEVTKIGEKTEDLHRVVTPSDTNVGDEHSKKFHGRN